MALSMTAAPAQTVAGSMLGATANLFISAAGAGLLSYPFAVMNQGIIVNIVLTLLFAVLNGYTDCILGQAAWKHRRAMHMRTYEELCMLALGKRAYDWAAFSVVVGCVGSLVGFLVIVGDMATDVVADMCSQEPSSACAIVSTRAFLVLAFTVFIALPLSSCDRIHHLWGSSILAGVTVLAVGGLVVRHGVDSLQHPSLPLPPGNATLAALHSAANVAACRTDNGPLYLARPQLALFLGMPISIFSLGNHIQAVVVFAELPHAAQKLWHVVVGISVSLCVVLYLSTGVFGYIACREGTAGDLLNNFPASDAFADAAKALMTIHIVLALPVIVLPCRRAFVMLWSMYCAKKVSSADAEAADSDALRPLEERERLLAAHDARGQSRTSSAGVPDSERDTVRTSGGDIQVAHAASASLSRCEWISSSLRSTAGNAAVLLVAAAMAILFPQVQVVFGLLGATVAVSQIYVFPGLMLLADAHEKETKQADATVEDDEGDVWYTPRSPAWMRVHAYGLLAIAVFVAVVGTGTNVWSSFFS